MALKNVIRYANPAAVMKGVLDLFLAQPFGARSLMQRIFSLALSDGVRATQKSIDSLYEKIQEPALCDKIRIFTESDEELKADLRREAEDEEIDIMVVLLRSPKITPELQSETLGRIFNAFVAYNNAVDNASDSSQRLPLLSDTQNRSIKKCAKVPSSLRTSGSSSNSTPASATNP